MPDTTTIQSLPLIQPSQAQKHVTHNKAMKLVDVMIQLTVADRDLTVAPGSPALGEAHIVAAGASGDWAGQDGSVAVWNGTIWEFFAPKLGWTAWLADAEERAVFDGSDWVAASEGAAVFAELGVSATPDATNRLSVSSPAVLLNHAGAGHQVKVNKAAAGDTASLLFQTGFSGRAEMGTTGSDDFAIKVSADGASFHDGLTVAAGSGKVTAMNGFAVTPVASDPGSPADGTLWLNSTAGQLRARIGGVTADVLTSIGMAVDASFILQDDADPTKKAKFELSGVTAGQTRSLTVPDADGTLVLAAAAQTLTNKSIVATQLTGTLQAAQAPAHSGDVTGSAGSLALTIASNAVTLAKMATLATARFLGRSTAGTGDPEAMTGTEATALLDVVASGAKGLAPASGGGTANFLRADGGWVDPRSRFGLAPYAPAAGEFTANSLLGAALATSAAVADQTRISPWLCPYDITVDQIGLSITTGAAGNAKGIIYASDSLGRPGAVVAETPNIDTSASGTYFGTLASSVTLTGGKLYWLGVRTSATPTLNRMGGGTHIPLGWTNAATPVPYYCLLKTETFASAPASWTYSSGQRSALTMYLVLMRVA